MGNTKSKQSFQSKLKNEMQILSNGIQEIFSSQGLDVMSEEYRVSKENLCQKFTYVLEQSLHKYQKSKLEDYRDNIIIIPKKESNTKPTKSDICQSIANHYNRLLLIARTIYEILDIEHNGELSIAGICIRNINEINELIEIRYCQSKQYHNNVYTKKGKDKKVKIARKIDFSQLSGFSILMDEFLSKDEARIFKNLIGSLLMNKRMSLNQADKLVVKSFKSFENDIFDMNKELNSQKGGSEEKHHLFKVAEIQPVLSIDTCYIQNKYIVSKTKLIENKLRKQENDLLKVVILMNRVANDIVIKKDDEIELLVLTDRQLTDIENTVKHIFMTFYLQSIVNYNCILKTAENMPNLNSNV